MPQFVSKYIYLQLQVQWLKDGPYVIIDVPINSLSIQSHQNVYSQHSHVIVTMIFSKEIVSRATIPITKILGVAIWATMQTNQRDVVNCIW